MAGERQPKVVAFIDLGTNSMRLLVVRVEPDGSYAVLTRQKESVRLGEGEFANDEMQPEAIDRAVLVGARFAEMARSFGADEMYAVATSATREASNKRELLDRLQDEGGLDVRIVSGREEARLIYLGVASDVRLNGDTALFVDIGGGSTELIVGDGSSYSYLDTLRLGAIRLANLYFLPGDPNAVGPERFELVRRYVRANIARTVQRLREFPISVVVGSSGTVMTLGDIATRKFLGRPLDKNDVVPAKQIKQVVELLASLPLDQRLRVPGMTPSRGDIIVPGGVILDALLEELGAEAVTVSDRSLRDGLLIDYLARHDEDGEMQQLSFRMHSVLRLARRCRADLDHARQIARLSLEMFDGAREIGLHALGDWERELLEYAALLHDIGAFLSYTNHRQHSYYFIRNAELLGFDDTEIDIVATTALFHKKTYPRKRHVEFTTLDKRGQKIVRILCTFLRIAESLDRSHASVLHRARFVPGPDGEIALELEASGTCDLEMWAVDAHAKAFRRTFGRDLVVRTREQPAADLPRASDA